MLNIIEINFYTRSIDFILNVLYLQKKKNKIEYLPITKKSKIETKIITHPRFHATKNPRKISRHRSSRSWLEESIEYIEHVPGTFTLSEIIRYFFFFFFSFPFSPIYDDVYCFYVYRSVHTRMPTKIIPADV